MKLLLLLLTTLLLSACATAAAAPAPTPQIVKVPFAVPGPTIEVPGPTVEVATPECISALEAADDLHGNWAEWLDAMVEQNFTKADRLSEEAGDFIDAYNEWADECRDTARKASA